MAPARPTRPAAIIGVALLCGWTALSFLLCLRAAEPFRQSIRTAAAGLPFGAGLPGPLERAARLHASGLVTVAAILAAGAGVGPAVGRFIGGVAGGTALTCLLGWGSLACLLHGLGLLGLFHPPVLGAICAASVIPGLRAVARTAPRVWRRALDGPAVAVTLLGANLAIALLLSRLPDSHSDERIYHFAEPEHWLLLHKINDELQNPIWHLSRGMEMLFVPLWWVGSIEAAKALNVAMLCVLAALTQSLAIGVGATAGAGIWGAAWVTGTGLLVSFGWHGKNDLGAITAITGVIWCVVRSREGGRRWLLPGALLAGQALAIKWISVLPLGMIALQAVPGARVSRRSWGPAALLVALYPVTWCLENAGFTGNPAYPFLAGWITSPRWDAESARVWVNLMERFRPAGAAAPADVLLAAWRVFGDPQVGSPMLLALLPFAWIAGRTVKGRPVGRAVLLTYAAWLFTLRNPRYVFAVVPAVCALAAAGMDVVDMPGHGIRRSARSVLSIASAAVVWLALGAMLVPGWTSYLAGRTDRNVVLERRHTTWQDAMRWMSDRLPPTARVLLVGEDRRLWCTRRIVSEHHPRVSVLQFLARESRGPDEMGKRIRQTGVTHLAYNFIGAEFVAYQFPFDLAWTRTAAGTYRAFLARCSVTVWESSSLDNANGGFVILDLRARPAGSSERPIPFLPGAESLARTARQLILDIRLPEALAEHRSLSRALPGVGEYSDMVGFMAAKVGRWREAYEVLRPSVGSGVFNMVNLPILARTALELERLDEADRLHEILLAHYPDSRRAALVNLSDSRLRRAKHAIRERRWSDAKRFAGEALEFVAGHEGWAYDQTTDSARINDRQARELLREAETKGHPDTAGPVPKLVVPGAR